MMASMIAAVFLILLGLYLACGLVLALPLVLVGLKWIDPNAIHGSRGFRLIIVPGAVALWPILLHRWARGVPKPPEERGANRRPNLHAEQRAQPARNH